MDHPHDAPPEAEHRPPEALTWGWAVSIALAALMSFWWLFPLAPAVFSLLGPWRVPAGVALTAAGVAVGVRSVVDCVDVTIDARRGVSPDQGSLRSTVLLVAGDLVAAAIAGVVMRPDAGMAATALLILGVPMAAVTLLWERPWTSATAEDAASVERLGASFAELTRELEADRADLPRRYSRHVAQRDGERKSTPTPWPDARDGVELDPYRRRD